MKTPLAVLILVSFLITSAIGPLPRAGADEYRLPALGVMVHLSPPLDPPILKGIKVHPDDPFRFDFILDQGDKSLSPAVETQFKSPTAKQSNREYFMASLIRSSLRDESTKLIKYFLASLTIPEKDLWVTY